MALRCTVLCPTCLPITPVLAAACSKCWLDIVIQHAHYQAFLPNFQACGFFLCFTHPSIESTSSSLLASRHTAGSVLLCASWMGPSALQAVLALFFIPQILSITAFPIGLPIDTKLSPLAGRQDSNTGVPSITALPDYVLQYAPVMYLHSKEKW